MKNRWIRLGLTLVALGAWFTTQSFLQSRGTVDGITDHGQLLLAPLNAYFNANSSDADMLLAISSAFIDLFGLFLLIWGIVGPSPGPLFGLFALFFLRQISELLVALPTPDHMIWHSPGIPSLFVTYKTGNDFFFSGHTAIAVYGALEISRFQKSWLSAMAFVIAFFEALTVLVLRAHFTMDVIAGAFAAIAVFGVVSFASARKGATFPGASVSKIKGTVD